MYHVLRGDGSILSPRRVNHEWVKPFLVISNFLLVIGLSMDYESVI